MKYSKFLQRKAVPEWSVGYLNYKYLKTMLKPFKIYLRSINLSKKPCSHCETDSITVPSLSINDEEQAFSSLFRFSKDFESCVGAEKLKVEGFFLEKLLDLEQKFDEIKRNCEIFISSGDGPKTKQILKNCSLSFFRELDFLSKFHGVNYEGFRKILKKYSKLVKEMGPQFVLKTNIVTLYSNANYDLVRLHKLQQSFELLFLETFFCPEHRSIGKGELENITRNKLISDSEGCFFGFFFGAAVILLLVIIFLALEGDLDPDKEEAYFRDIFNMYRGIALFIAYVWLLAWNVWLFMVHQVNYRLIFAFNEHFSPVSAIMKRAAVFSSVFFISFIWYIINCEKTGKVSALFLWFPKEYCPLICWGVFLGYLFFPLKGWFNSEGRLFVFRLLRDILCFSCIKKVTFLINWATDQMVSIVIPLCDFEYTLCYYISKFTGEDVGKCTEADILLIPFVAAVLPLILRMIQCLNANKTKTGKTFSPNTDFLNFLKYLSSFITVCFSLSYNIAPQNSTFLVLWTLAATFSSLYSFYWDVRMDWGFKPGSRNKWLRDQLSVPGRKYYYISIALNLVLRFAWIVSLSYGIIQRTLGMRKEVIILVLGFLEIVRRANWNFIRVEREHITNCGGLQAVEKYELPYSESAHLESARTTIIAEGDPNESEKELLVNEKEEGQKGKKVQERGFLQTSERDLEALKREVRAFEEDLIAKSPTKLHKK